MIKLLASDMDGTLLHDDHLVSERNKAAINKWTKEGRFFVPTTGRPMSGMGHISALFEDDMPFILYNGAMAIMHRSKKKLFSITMPRDLALEVYLLGVERGLPVVLWCKDSSMYVNLDCKATQEYQRLICSPINLIGDRLDDLVNEGVINILWLDKPEEILNYQKNMQDRFKDKVNCYASRPDLFEFVDINASKANALEKVGKMLGVTQKEIAAIGDGYNDLSMLRYAGYSIAMGNAPDDIKAECDYVTLTNNEDGVAAWVESVVYP